MIRSGLIGRSIQASRSPWLHEQEARAQGFELDYALYDFDALDLADADLGAFVDHLRKEETAGFNVTYPFKQAVIEYLDALAPSAAAVGAVNTVAIRDGRMTGHNTDMTGFRSSVADGLPGADFDCVLQLGAGGAGAAVAAALIDLGTRRLEICDVDPARAEALAQRLQARAAGRVVVRDPGDHSTADVTGIVNATPVGMLANTGIPIDPRHLSAAIWVADIVYFPRDTALLTAARERGCRTLDGSGMVVRQAAEAFQIITGAPSCLERMLANLDDER